MSYNNVFQIEILYICIKFLLHGARAYLKVNA